MMENLPIAYLRSCTPTCGMKTVYKASGKVHELKVTSARNVGKPTRAWMTFAFDPDYMYEQKELECCDHEENMEECPKEQERLEFQRKELEALKKTNPTATTVPRPGRAKIQNALKIYSSCDPNAFVKLSFAAFPECSGYQVLLSRKLKEGEKVAIPFPVTWKESPVPLKCQKHHNNMKACPMENKRIKHAAMLKMENEKKLVELVQTLKL